MWDEIHTRMNEREQRHAGRNKKGQYSARYNQCLLLRRTNEYVGKQIQFTFQAKRSPYLVGVSWPVISITVDSSFIWAGLV